jgi:parallel beta-helix repeat protein
VKKTIVGIIGIAGREGSDIRIEGCTIERNSWDGIALYRGARASIQDNVVDGIDSAAGATVGGGRGVGIGLTWDARATIVGNLVRHYWKGIGVFVDARADVRGNVIEDVLTWGLSLWDAGKGKPAAEFRRNVVYRTGACGAMIARGETGDPPPGALAENILVMTGQNPKYDSGEPYCRQQALADEAVPAGFLVSGNVFSENREPGGKPGGRDVDRRTFVEKARGLLPRSPGWALSRSRFFTDFPELLDTAHD